MRPATGSARASVWGSADAVGESNAPHFSVVQGDHLSDKAGLMSRRDLAADLDRPHFYSQFWIDVASGKRDVVAAPAAETEAEFEEAEEPEFEPVAKVAPPVAVRKPAKAPERKPEPVRPALTSLADLANIDLLMKSSAEMDGDEIPDIEAGPTSDLAPIVTDFDLDEVAAAPEAAASDDEFEGAEFDEDEEEEGGDWGARRKPSKPTKTDRRRERPEKRGF